MSRVKSVVKKAFLSVGLSVTKRDQLAEQIPREYFRSPYLPPICRQSLGRLFYFHHMIQRVAAVPGDLVECGVSIGYGILNWALLTELSGSNRRIVGFDSFAGFPASTEADRTADGNFSKEMGEYTSPPELVLKVLEDGSVSADFVARNVRLVRGYFESTLPRYSGSIALLHLDCDLYESYRTCLEQLYRLVVPGGIIMFDEYEDPRFPGAKRAIDEFFSDKVENPVAYQEYETLKFHVVKSS